MTLLRVLLLAACLSALAHGLLVPTTTVINTQTGTATAQALPSTTAPSLLSSIKWPVFPTTAPAAPTTTTAAASPAQPTTSPAAAPTTALTGGSCPDPQGALNLHNQARAARAARALSWSPSLASSAQAYANRCVFQHSGTAGVGENLFMSSSASATCSDAVKMWVAEAPYYIGSYSSSTGHWTQIVWKSTTAVGCGLARCSFGALVVCQYSPQGNIMGQFGPNV